MNTTSSLELFDNAVLNGTATWWQMELPSGDVIFGEAKAKMLGYPDSDFRTYQDFVKLVHPEDTEKTMQAMRDHLEGKTDLYEALYRIRASDGQYLQFYDCGQIIKQDGGNITVAGFVLKIDDVEQAQAEMRDFKKLLRDGDPSIFDLLAKST